MDSARLVVKILLCYIARHALFIIAELSFVLYKEEENKKMLTTEKNL